MTHSFWIILDKPYGMTSNRALSKVKRLFGLRKAGFSGTLDPLATGVLPIAFGEALKTMHYMTFSKKAYTFQVRWGQETTTADREGEVIQTSSIRPTFEQIQHILPQFTGQITQTPPIYSAIKVDGKRAYDLARQNVEVKLKERMVTIYDLQLISIDDEDHAAFAVECSAGTYIRSLGVDLAKALGTVAHLSQLRRTSVGCFSLETSISLEYLGEIVHTDAILAYKHSLGIGLDDILAVSITEDDYTNAKLGRRIPCALHLEEEALVRMWVEGDFAGFAVFKEGGLSPKRLVHRGAVINN